MINKEIILNADGSIKKDFVDRNIPQNSNNQVSVNVLIPSQCFTGLQNYAVLLAVSRIISNVETTLNTLVMSVAKSITIDGVVYVKYTAYLSSAYTDKIGQLKLSPYIQTTAESTSGGTTTTIISIQQSFTNSNLNVIKSVLPQYDASLEEATTATTLEGQINGKKIYTFIDDATSEGEHYYNLVDGFNPSVDQFKGCLVVSVWNDTTFIMPYLVEDDVELLEITKDGKFYLISGVDYDSGTSTYTYTRLQLSYSKGEIDTLIYKKTETYNKAETDALLNDKVDKTTKVNGHALSGDITLTKGDVGLGNVANYGVETTPTTTGENLYITSKGVYDALQIIYGILDGKVDDADLTSIENRLNSIEEIIGSDSGDADSVINTLKEVIVVLNGLGEGANLLDLINAKANQSDLNALNTQINGTGGIKDKVDILSERNNAYMEIKNSVGTIDIAVSDWVANTGDSEYPYKYELTNGYLEGAVNCIVVYSKDSDTSMLSATTGIDEVNGKLVIYASEIPSATISIEKIAVFNDLNSYINYSNEIVQQVLSNTSAISDINNTKLPNKANQSALDKGIYYTTTAPTSSISVGITHILETQYIENINSNISIKNNDLIIYLKDGEVDSIYNVVSVGEAPTPLSLNKIGEYSKGKNIYTSVEAPTFDDQVGRYTLERVYITPANSAIEAGDILLYVNSGNIGTIFSVYEISGFDVILDKIGDFSTGGGSQLYRHCIKFYNSSTNCISCDIISDRSEAYDNLAFRNYLNDKGLNGTQYNLPVVGQHNSKLVISIYYRAAINQVSLTYADGSTSSFAISGFDDKVIAL